ncbi:MAG: PrsW family intramembrane metalloprotease [Candidatus Bilamarchaeaceae archaeon]
MLGLLNRVFIAFAVLIAVCGIGLSVLLLGLDFFVGGDPVADEIAALEQNSEIVVYSSESEIRPAESPYRVNITIFAPPMAETDLLSLRVYGENGQLAEQDCLEDFETYEDYSSLTEFSCAAPIPYAYTESHEYKVIAVLNSDGSESVSEPVSVSAQWGEYEGVFWGIAIFILLVVGGTYLFFMLPLTYFVIRTALRLKHKTAYEGEYSLGNLLSPFNGTKSLLQRFNSFIVSPYFWAIEGIGIVFIVIYIAFSAQIWSSGTALIAFVLSGLVAFIIPYLWCAALWYGEYKEREPIRVIVTLLLWGMLAALMAIGINSLTSVIFAFVGMGFLGSFLVAPPVEEFCKGSGLCLLSTHHEFDSVEDGFLYGFVIGMGFSFVENWLYFIQTPMGADIWGWVFLFFTRCILFSANHGFYTAITGGFIGWLIEKKFPAPALGILVGAPIAAFFHAMHNSGETLITLLGVGGALAYCCILIPVFDYGGLIVFLGLFAWMLLRGKRGNPAETPAKAGGKMLEGAKPLKHPVKKR